MAKLGKNTKIQRTEAAFVAACQRGDSDAAHAAVEVLIALFEREAPTFNKPEKIPVWNTDSAWILYCSSVLETDIRKIANKYTTDTALREDCEQEAREAVYQLFPEKVKGFADFKNGLILEPQWKSRLRSYCRNAIRNAILSYLDSPKTGNWYIGRTRKVRDKVTGEKKKVHVGSRYSSLESLTEDSGLQVDEFGQISWDHTSDDGLQNESVLVAYLKRDE